MSKQKTKPLRALVVDDEPLARDELIFLLGELGVSIAGEADDASSALELYDANEVDVVFVDLHMPGPDGIALAESLMRRGAEALVVVSAHDDGAIRAFEAGVVDYLLKPVRLERLRKAVERVGHRSDGEPKAEEAELTRLAVKRRGKLVVVSIEDVVYFEVADELVWAVTEDDRYALDLTLSAIEKQVPKQAFFRSHRGCLVRLDRIVGFEPMGAGTYELQLRHPDDPRVPLARERARQLKQLIPIAG